MAPTAAINPQTLTTLVLRPHGGSNIAIQTRTYPQSNVTIIELIPTSPLPASTQFEVSVVTPDAHPPTTVAATFKTAANSDMAPPQFAGIGHQSTHLNPAAAGSACEIAGPWIRLEQLDVQDDWPGAQLHYGVWSADALGNINTRRLPDAIVLPSNGGINIGQTSLCDPFRFSLKGPIATFAVAAFDQSGNMSPSVTIRADITRNVP